MLFSLSSASFTPKSIRIQILQSKGTKVVLLYHLDGTCINVCGESNANLSKSNFSEHKVCVYQVNRNKKKTELNICGKENCGSLNLFASF